MNRRRPKTMGVEYQDYWFGDALSRLSTQNMLRTYKEEPTKRGSIVLRKLGLIELVKTPPRGFGIGSDPREYVLSEAGKKLLETKIQIG